jgi:hypothetical protein
LLYYFNVIDGLIEITDSEGAHFGTEEAAHAEALKIISELLRDFPDRFGPRTILEVHSEEGRRVFALSLFPHKPHVSAL